MLIRAAFLVALTGAAVQFLSFRSQTDAWVQCGPTTMQAIECERSRLKPVDASVALTRPDIDDIPRDRRLEAVAPVIRQIAIYRDIGNLDGAEILREQIRAAGISKDKLDEAVAWTRLHDDSGQVQRLNDCGQSDVNPRPCAF